MEHICHRITNWRFACILLFLTAACGRAAAPDYEQPKMLTGTVLARGTTNVLFRFKRTAVRDNETVSVLREFATLDGKVAARERCTFVSGRLTMFALEELQSGSHGSTAVNGQNFQFEYTARPGARRKTGAETVRGEALIGDMIPYFLAAHWDEIMRGHPAAFRFIAQDRLETVGFKLLKDGEQTWKGRSVVRVKMEPTSRIVAALVDPLFFVVEKEGSHRILQYDGRTTPKVNRGGSWKDLDAVTVYDWD